MDKPEPNERKSELDSHVEANERGLLGEFWDFLKHNKKWWLTPIIVVLLLLGALVILGGSGAAPFIYTLF